MNYKELIQKIVEAEDMDERMTLAEELTESFEAENGGENDSTELAEKIETLTKTVEDLTTQVTESKQKYRDRFFSGEKKTEETEEEETEENNITTSDIVSDMSGKKKGDEK